MYICTHANANMNTCGFGRTFDKLKLNSNVYNEQKKKKKRKKQKKKESQSGLEGKMEVKTH